MYFNTSSEQTSFKFSTFVTQTMTGMETKKIDNINLKPFEWYDMNLFEFELWEEKQWKLVDKSNNLELKQDLLNQLLIEELTDRFGWMYQSISLRADLKILEKYKDIITKLFYRNTNLKQVLINDGGPLPSDLMDMILKHNSIKSLYFRVNNLDSLATIVPFNYSIQEVNYRFDDSLNDDNTNLVFQTLENCKNLLAVDFAFQLVQNGLSDHFMSKFQSFLNNQNTPQAIRIQGKSCCIERLLPMLGNSYCRSIAVAAPIQDARNLQDFFDNMAQNPFISSAELEVDTQNILSLESFKSNFANFNSNFTLNKLRLEGPRISEDLDMNVTFVINGLEAITFQNEYGLMSRLLRQSPSFRDWTRNLLLLSRRVILLKKLLPFEVLADLLQRQQAADIGPTEISDSMTPPIRLMVKTLLNRNTLGKIVSPFKFGFTELLRRCQTYDKVHLDGHLGDSIITDLKQKKNRTVTDGDSDIADDNDRYELRESDSEDFSD